jgi:hypothetical protein
MRPFISVLWCPLRFPRKIDVRFGSCFIYFICIYFRILVSITISCGAGSANLSGAPLLKSGVHVDWSLVFCIMFYGSLFVMLWFLPLFSLSFDLRLLITPLVSSNYYHLNVMFSVEENKQRFNIQNNILWYNLRIVGDWYYNLNQI